VAELQNSFNGIKPKRFEVEREEGDHGLTKKGELMIELKLIELVDEYFDFFTIFFSFIFHISPFSSYLFIVGVGVNDEEELLITNTKSRRLLSGDISDGTMGGGGGEEEEKGNFDFD